MDDRTKLKAKPITPRADALTLDEQAGIMANNRLFSSLKGAGHGLEELALIYDRGESAGRGNYYVSVPTDMPRETILRDLKLEAQGEGLPYMPGVAQKWEVPKDMFDKAVASVDGANPQQLTDQLRQRFPEEHGTSVVTGINPKNGTVTMHVEHGVSRQTMAGGPELTDLIRKVKRVALVVPEEMLHKALSVGARLR